MTPAASTNRRAWASAVGARRRVEHEQGLVRRPGDLAGGDPPHLRELLHQVLLRVEPSRRVDEQRAGRRAPSPPTRASKRTAEGSAPSRWRIDGEIQPIRPDRELLDRSRAERVRGGQEDRSPVLDCPRRELGRRRRLPGSVDADQEDDLERRRRGRRPAAERRREQALDLLGQEPAAAPSRSVRSAPARPRPDRVGQRRRPSPLRRRPRSAPPRATPEPTRRSPSPFLTAVPELLEDLGVGHEQPALDLREEAGLAGEAVGASGGSFQFEVHVSSWPVPLNGNPRRLSLYDAGRRFQQQAGLGCRRRPSGRARPCARGSGGPGPSSSSATRPGRGAGSRPGSSAAA